jgi:hypothetical protein
VIYVVQRHGHDCHCYDCVQEWASKQPGRFGERRGGRGRSGPPIAKNPANQEAVNRAWEAQQAKRGGKSRRMRQYDKATNRPEGEQEAGNTWVNGQPAYYEDGRSTGKPNHRDRYYGPNGPFGSNHHHDGSEDDGVTWENYH